MGINLSSITDQKLREKINELDRQQNRRGVRAVEAPRQERNKILALDGGGKVRKQSKGSVAICITLVSCRRREIDDDSNIYSCAEIRDAIAASLGIDDADKRIRWSYGQVVSPSTEGVIVKIELL